MDLLSQAREHFVAALAAQEQGDLARAEQLLRLAHGCAPDRASILVNLAAVLVQRGMPADAARFCDTVLAADPSSLHAWINLALARRDLGEMEGARQAIQRALEIEPGNATALGNCGVIFVQCGLAEAGLEFLERALEVDPNDAAWHTSRGLALRLLERLPESAQAHRRALQLQPGYADASWNLALVELALGNYRAGWTLFEARWHTREAVFAHHTGPQPRWQGEALGPGTRLLVWAEQGLGDALQFVRFLPELASRGVEVFLELPPSLVRLVQANNPAVTVLAQGERRPAHDLHCPLLSLAGLLDAAPAHAEARAYLRAPDDALHSWSARLAGLPGPRIGVMWQGNQANRSGRGRSLPASRLASVMHIPAGWYFVGKDIAEEDRSVMSARGRFHDFSPLIRDFADTAALIAQMDLVVTIDTSVAHLAAAMGRETWVLLSAGADWRWGLPDARHSPWYPPSTRLFRQKPGEDWSGVLDELAQALARRFG